MFDDVEGLHVDTRKNEQKYTGMLGASLTALSSLRYHFGKGEREGHRAVKSPIFHGVTKGREEL